jgi:Transposase
VVAEASAPGVTVREVSRRLGIPESLIYNWRSAQRKAASIATEPLQFLPYSVVTDAVPAEPGKALAQARPGSAPAKPSPPAAPPEDLVRPHPGKPARLHRRRPADRRPCPAGLGRRPVFRASVPVPGQARRLLQGLYWGGSACACSPSDWRRAASSGHAGRRRHRAEPRAAVAAHRRHRHLRRRPLWRRPPTDSSGREEGFPPAQAKRSCGDYRNSSTRRACMSNRSPVFGRHSLRRSSAS